MRMVAAIAKIRGYDIKSDQVRTFVYICLAGSGTADAIKNTTKVVVQKSAKEFIKNKISTEIINKINQHIGYRLLTKFGEKGVSNIGRIVPLLGGVIGGGFDYITTKAIALRAMKEFEKNDNGPAALTHSR